MNKSFSLLLFLISILSFGQIKFKTGYFITNDGTKTECFIKDMAWKDYPDSFLYKYVEDGEQKKAYLQNVKEFSVDNTKYVKFNIQLDNSPTSLNSIGTDRKPIWISQTAFLKLLSDGETRLYKYSKSGNVKYFIQKANSEEAEQLIYKQYLIEEKNQTSVANNNDYQKQLSNLNPNLETSKLKYSDKSLINWFASYTGKTQEESLNKEKGKFNARAKLGFLYSKSKSTDNSSQSDSGSNFSFSPSLELEYVFAFNKNKWSIFAEFAYTGYSKKTNVVNTIYNTFIENRLYEIENKSIIIPTGFKHYLFLNDDNKIFISAAATSNITLKYKAKVSDPTTNTTYSDYTDSGFAVFSGYQLGLGYIYKNKFSIEGKFISDSSLISSDVKFYGLTLGYTIF